MRISADAGTFADSEARPDVDSSFADKASGSGVTAAYEGPAHCSVPAQLPRRLDSFTGRAEELAMLEALAQNAAGNTVPVAAIDGAAGIGKTALAVHFAHHIAARFPGGQLYVDLRGFDPSMPPVPPTDVLAQFLRALGADHARLPANLDEQAAMFRSVLASRRVLVVLDNAASANQVRPLLPGTPGCLVLVTSRNRLGGLVARDGARRLTLATLPVQEAVTLLADAIGTDRTAAEPAAARDLAHLCGCLPLALRIAAERVASRSHSSLEELAAELAVEGDRLDVLAVGDDDTAAVRPAFSWSYHALPPPAARAFRLLGLHAGPDLSTHAAAALAGIPEAESRKLLAALAAGHLLQQIAPNRYRFHDLLRLYAAERAMADEADQARAEAVQRVLAWYLHTSDAMRNVLCQDMYFSRPLGPVPADCQPLQFSSDLQALTWYETERANLIAATQHAAQAGHAEIAWRLPVTLSGVFLQPGPPPNWVTACHAGLAAATRIGDRHGQAWALGALAAANCAARQLEETLVYGHKALTAFREIGDKRGQAWILGILGLVCSELQRRETALQHCDQAVAICTEIGDRRARANALFMSGIVRCRLQQPEEALQNLRRALEIYRKCGYNYYVNAWILFVIAAALRNLAQHAEATDALRQAAAMFDTAGDRHAASRCLNSLSANCRHLAQFQEAIAAAAEALALCRALGDRYGEAVSLDNLGAAQQGLGMVDAARRSWRQALIILSDLNDPREAKVRTHLESLDAP